MYVAGAFGYFEVTHDITKYCKAKIFEKVGKRTPVGLRFSTVGELSIIIQFYGQKQVSALNKLQALPLINEILSSVRG